MSHFDQFADETIYHRLSRLIDRLDNHTFSRLSNRDAETVNHVRRELQQIANMLYLARQEYAELPDLATVINDLLKESHAGVQQPVTITPEVEAYHRGWQGGLMELAQECGLLPLEENEK